MDSNSAAQSHSSDDDHHRMHPNSSSTTTAPPPPSQLTDNEDDDHQHQQQRPPAPMPVTLLENRWAFWHDTNQPLKKWSQDNVVMLSEFDSVQQFWHCYRQLPPFDSLKGRLCLFKSAIRPEWEDPENINGGAWNFRVSRPTRPPRPHEESVVETVWKDLLVAIIGEQFHAHLIGDDDICGLSVSSRQLQFLFQVWNRKGDTNTSLLLERIQEILASSIDSIQSLEYKKHDNRMAFKGPAPSSSSSSSSSSFSSTKSALPDQQQQPQ